MAYRLLSYENVDPHDIIEFFAVDAPNDKITDSGSGDNGVFVKVSNGDLNQSTPAAVAGVNVLGKTNFPYVGYNKYFTSPLTVTAATSGDLPLGITLKQTAVRDENGRYFMDQPVKRDEWDVVESGHATPIAKHGTFTVYNNAYQGELVVGYGFKMSDTQAGKIVTATGSDSIPNSVVLATGSRTALTNTDRYAGTTNGTYAIISF